jgi:L-alanine-DL-glutamate epimerase-like enolase superfamily enzyme
MRLSWEDLTLDLKVPFRLAHGASEKRFNVLVRLSEGNDEGLGEAAAVPYYGESRDGIIAYLETVGDLGDDPSDLDDVLGRLPPGSRSARAAIDGALHDLWGKRLGQPVYRLWGLNPARLPSTSFTIGLDEPDAMAEQARTSGHAILKIKLGSDRDEEIIMAVRSATSARLRVDANAGWSRERTLELLPLLAECGVEFVEQPLAVDDIEGYFWLRDKRSSRNLTVPVFADESVRNSRDLVALAGAVDGVVVKTMKSGGLREALRMIHTARAFGMRTMLGCMVESSVAVTAAAHLAPLCDHADLDGPLLIRNDRWTGLRYEGAKLILSEGPGVGLMLRP